MLEYSTLASIGFARPMWLFAIPVLCSLALWIGRQSIGAERGGRRTLGLAIRCLVFALLCICLAEPDLRRKAKDVAVVAIVDVSDSVPSEQQRKSLAFLESSLQQRQGGDRFGMITVARDALVQSLPSSASARVEAGFLGATDTTDIESGVQLARGLLPPDAGGRIVLLSDGNQNRGNAREAARSFSNAGIPIDVVPMEYDRSDAIRVDAVTAPSWTRDEETINVRVLMHSGREAAGRLQILLNGQAVDLDPDSSATSIPLTLRAGDQVFSLPLKLPSGTTHQLKAVFEPNDVSLSVPQLLSAQTAVFTSDRAHVLVLAESKEAAAPLINAIQSETVRVDVRSASDAPYSLAEWAAFDSVILFDQPSYNFSQQQQEDLVRYVNDSGGGLLMVGGPNSFGAGGWIGTSLADALPIRLDPPQKRQMPMGALAIIIDASGSMGSPVQGTDMTQQQIADEAAVLAVRGLSRLDQVAVIAFSGDSEVVVPLQACSDADGIARKIRSIGPGGGTNLFPAIDAAADELSKTKAGVRHIIILTDGQTEGDPADGIARAAKLKTHGITISTVAIGDGSNDPLLTNIAKTAGGRFYSVRSENSWAVLPQIFVKEAQTVRRSLIWEGGAFSPKPEFLGESMRGIAMPLPGITGYVVSADRPGLATVALRGPEGDPILAQWQRGLGRVMTYASDASTRWNASWIAWGGYHAFWEQQLKWVSRPSGDANARIAIEDKGSKARVIVDLVDPSGERVNFAALRGRVARPPGGSQASADVSFRQVGPGRYEAEVDAEDAGLHLVSIRYEAPGANGTKITGALRAAIERRAGNELLRPLPNTELLREVATVTKGQSHRVGSTGVDLWSRDGITMPETARPIWSHLALLLMALFLADVAVRRVWIEPDSLVRSVRRFFGRAPDKASAGLSTLAATKARAAASMPKATNVEPVHISAAQSQWAPDAPAIQLDIPAPDAPKPAPKQMPKQADDESPADMMSRLRGAKNRARDDAQNQ